MTGKGAAPRAGRLAYDALGRCHGARIVAAHARAANLLLEDGSIVTLLPAGTPLHPWALAGVTDPARLTRDSAVSVRDGEISLGGKAFALSALCVCDLAIPRRPAALTRADTAMLDRLADTLRQQDAHACLQPASPSPFESSIRQAIARFAADGNVCQLSGLIGVGSGLTPSGDDVLLGILAAADTLRHALPEASRIHGELAAILSAPLDARTSRVSAQMLYAAAQGRYPEPLLELTDAIVSRDMRQIEHAAAAVRTLGHRSGGDLLNGFAAALPTCQAKLSNDKHLQA